MDTLGWEASVVGLLFRELFLSHRLPSGRRGRKGLKTIGSRKKF